MDASGEDVSVLKVEDFGLVSEYDKEVEYILGGGAIQTVFSSGTEIPPQNSSTGLIAIKVAASPGTAVCIEGSIFFDGSNM